MIEWVESQSVAGIALLVFGFCYALAAAVFAAAAGFARRPAVAAALKATTPVMLTPLAVIAGLLIAFLASRVWANLDRANALVAQEAGALREALVLADALPDDTGTTLRDAMGSYLRFVVAEDFPAMAKGRAELREPPALLEAMGALLAFSPSEPRTQLVRDRASAAVERVAEARRGRVLLSRSIIAPIQWAVVVLLDVLLLAVIAMVHVDRLATAAVSQFILSTAVASCLMLLMANDRPFGAGGLTVQPHALREIGLE